VTYIGHGLNSSSVELVHKFVVKPKFVELETELVLAVERALLTPRLNSDGAVGPRCFELFVNGIIIELAQLAYRCNCHIQLYLIDCCCTCSMYVTGDGLE